MDHPKCCVYNSINLRCCMHEHETQTSSDDRDEKNSRFSLHRPSSTTSCRFNAASQEILLAVNMQPSDIIMSVINEC